MLGELFDLGGDSLRLTRILAELRSSIAPKLSMIDLFQYPKIRTLAGRIESLEQEGQTAPPELAANSQMRAAKQKAMLKAMAARAGSRTEG